MIIFFGSTFKKISSARADGFNCRFTEVCILDLSPLDGAKDGGY